ncbi:MAG: PBP1A family penicillin-binding protein [Desulfomonile sp.]|nr:PBP1A family penicillin-binding protein [Desulfomonile sp.]
MAQIGGKLLGKTIFSALFLVPLLIVVQVPIFLLGAGLGGYLVFSRNLPHIPELMQYQPKTVSTFYADDGTVIGIFYREKRFVVELQQIPPHVIKAFLAAEDQRFYEHSGVDWLGFTRAAWVNLKAGRVVQGGSTITMQVTRNFLLTRDRRASRKIKEMLLAMELERLWGKDRILRIYLNEIYLGDGCYGVEAAARNYFDKPVEHLSIAEAATIAGLVASPAKYNPFKSKELAEARRRTVLERMLRFGFITREQYDKSVSELLVYRKEVVRPFDLVPDFAEAVRLQIIEKYGEEALYNRGLKVFTTARVDLQQKAVEAVQKGLAELRQRHKHQEIIRTVQPNEIQGLLEKRSAPALKAGKGYQGVVTKVRNEKERTILTVGLGQKLKGTVEVPGPTNVYRVGHVLALRFERFVDEVAHFAIDDTPQLQGALVLIENRTGFVRAIVGGASSEHYAFNRATQARRQPGSAFKPIIYATALEKGSYSPATIIVDEPITVEFPGTEPDWTPRNAGGDFLGPISLRRALELSRNICTVKLLMDMGFEEVIRLAKGMGIKSPLGENMSLSLGSSEVTLLELTSAYTVFPNSGVHVPPLLIKRVEDRHGNILEDNTNVPVLEAKQVPHPVPREEFRLLEGEEGEDAGQSEAGDGDIDAVQAPPKEGANPNQEELEQQLGTGDGQITIPKGPEMDKLTGGRREVRAVLSAETAYIMTNLLRGGVRSGTGFRMQQYLKRKDVAGKTGTTNKAMDAWFIGFTPEYTAGVWVGYDEKRPLGRGEEGGRAALPIWGYFMQDVLQNVPDKEFPVPPNIAFVKMLTYTGNARQGFSPTTVEEPVYAPFAGRTLVISPLDPPESLNQIHGTAPPVQLSPFASPPWTADRTGSSVPAVPPASVTQGYPPVDVRGHVSPLAPGGAVPPPYSPSSQPPGAGVKPPPQKLYPSPVQPSRPDVRGMPPPGSEGPSYREAAAPVSRQRPQPGPGAVSPPSGEQLRKKPAAKGTP